MKMTLPRSDRLDVRKQTMDLQRQATREKVEREREAEAKHRCVATCCAAVNVVMKVMASTRGPLGGSYWNGYEGKCYGWIARRKSPRGLPQAR